MTVNVDPHVVEAIETATWVGTSLAILVFVLLVYLMVRPKRRREEPRRRDEEAFDAQEMIRLMERMERRLEVLERAVTSRSDDEEHFLLRGGHRPEHRRTK